MKVVVLTTSYPRSPEDVAGRFVADAVERFARPGSRSRSSRRCRSATSGSPTGTAWSATSAGGPGSAAGRSADAPLLRARRPRRAARDADLVHAHWLPAGWVAARTGKPFVVQLWGTDVELARRAPVARAAGPAPRAARRSAPRRSSPRPPASSARADVRVIPSGVDVPPEPAPPDEPSARPLRRPALGGEGRARARRGGARTPARRRRRRPAARRACRARSGGPALTSCSSLYERAAVVVCPSHREGYGVVCAEAMAHGRPVVASAVGGLSDLVVDGETGLLVPPGDVAALRSALERLLGDPELRERLGRAARERARAEDGWTSRGRDPRRLRRPSRSYEIATPWQGARLRFCVCLRELTIDGVRIADDTDCYVIAEIGHNHQGSLEHVQGAVRGGRRAAARTRSSCRSATTARSTRREMFNRPYDNENCYGADLRHAPRGARVRPRRVRGAEGVRRRARDHVLLDRVRLHERRVPGRARHAGVQDRLGRPDEHAAAQHSSPRSASR